MDEINADKEVGIKDLILPSACILFICDLSGIRCLILTFFVIRPIGNRAKTNLQSKPTRVTPSAFHCAQSHVPHRGIRWHDSSKELPLGNGFIGFNPRSMRRSRSSPDHSALANFFPPFSYPLNGDLKLLTSKANS